MKYSVKLFNIINVFISHFDLYYEIQPKLHLWNYIKMFELYDIIQNIHAY